MFLKFASLTITMMAVSFGVAAEPLNGLYVGVGAGINIIEPGNAHSRNAGEQITRSLGPALVVQTGWAFGNGLRAEIEGSYRYNRITGETGLAGGLDKTTETKYGFMANVLYEYDLVSWASPYAGVGIGDQFVHEPNASGSLGTAHATVFGGVEGSFAYQLIAGIAFPIASAPGLAATLDYRFLDLVDDRTYTGVATAKAASVAVHDSAASYANHSIVIGLRYAF